MNNEHNGPVVFRQVALPVPSFDYLKEYQRRHEQAHGFRPNNNQCLTLILADHKQATSMGLLKSLAGATS
jgi:hypothetical protein